MRKALAAGIVLTALLLGSSAALAQGAAPDAELDRLIQRLEQSGALDRAMDRAVQRYIDRQNQARADAQTQEQRRQTEAAKNARPVSASRDHIFGNPQAEVSVIVYSDLECPFCKQFSGTPEQAIEKFNGNANFVFRHFPLDMHGPNAKKGAGFSECVGRLAGSQAFFAFVRDWFRLTGSNGRGLEGGDAQLKEIALAAGVKDWTGLQSCANDPGTAQVVFDDIADGTRAGVNGTPGTVVRNNKTGAVMEVTGNVPAQRIEEAIAQVLGH